MSDEGRFILKNVRLAFPNLWKATTVAGEGEPAFSAAFIFPADHPQIKQLEAEMLTVAKAKWGAKAEAIYKTLKATDKLAMHDGDTKAQYEGYGGNLFVSSRSKTRPTVFNRDRTPLVAEDGKPYSGCYVNASFQLWAQDNNYGKRINAQLRGVQFFKDGDAFSGGGQPAGDDEFPDLGADDEGDDPTK